MAHSRRLPQHRVPSSSISSPSTTRRKTLRRAASRLASDASSEFISSPLPGLRPPLVPLQANLRRLPSRLRFAAKGGNLDSQMREGIHVTVGSKRKRLTIGNENAHSRTARSSKRRKTASEIRRGTCFSSTSEESQSEDEMEVDNATTISSQSCDSNESEEQGIEEVDEEGDDSSDDFFLNEASPKRLNKLLKKKLVELYELTGLTESADSLKKSEIIDAIIIARDDVPLVPPSSPGRTDGASSDYQSSDDGNVAGDETDAPDSRQPPNDRQVIRRATIHDMAKLTPRPRNMKGRSVSMGNITGHAELSNSLSRLDKTVERSRWKASARSSSTISTDISSVTQQPPVTRLRSRQASGSLPDATIPASSSSKSKGKGKSKQVEFSGAVEVCLRTPSKRSSKGRRKESSEPESKPSDDVADVQGPSPRRLRSKGRERDSSHMKNEDSQATPVPHGRRRPGAKKSECEEVEIERQTTRRLRITPMRQAKVKGSLNESDADEEDSKHDDEGAEEVDELVSSASLSPAPESHSRRVPTKRRTLRPRATRAKPVPTGEEENEGDDEDEAAEEVEQDVEDDQDEVDADEDEDTVAIEPRKLRSGRIVGDNGEGEEEEGGGEGEEEEEEEEEEGGGEEEEEEEGEGEGEEEEEGEGDEEEEEENMEVDGDEDEDADDDEAVDDTASIEGSDSMDQEELEEVMEEEVDLTVATSKMLVRLRRDDLVRLCESREIEPSGTKPQLAEALLQWRDRQTNELSSQSSSGTVRPTSRRRRTRKDSRMTSTTTDVPVLLRSHHVHLDEPRTPVPDKENEDLELDLESLGLEDREIPPEKLTKLEKIGSGGFKDVFIGKFKSRKVAIAEFRGQLSAMDIKELKLLGAFHHNNIVRFVGVSIPENTKESPVMIVSELCSNGDLFDYIRNEKAPSLHKVLKLMLDIARGLEYLHTRKPSIIHRDCKSSNILITAKGVAKIADFGLAKVKQSTRSMVRSLVGTVNWQAPELWTAHPRYDHKVDVFSCAMVFWETLQWHLPDKKFPWEGMNEHAIYELVGAKKQRPSTSSLKKQWCPEVIELIEHMWSQEPQDRPAISEVVESLEELHAKY